MPTSAQIANYSKIIYDTAVAGTSYNPGVPPPLALLMVAQAKHETGNFASNAFASGNNAFGYSYYPGSFYQEKQPGPISDNGQALARYPSLQASTREVVDWIYRRQKEGKFPVDLSVITTPEKYAALLKGANYYSDSVGNYSSGLARWFVDLGETIKKNPGTSAGVGLVIIGGLLLLIFGKRIFAVK